MSCSARTSGSKTAEPLTTMVKALVKVRGSNARKANIGAMFDGAGNGIRTRDLQLGKLTLYH